MSPESRGRICGSFTNPPKAWGDISSLISLINGISLLNYMIDEEIWLALFGILLEISSLVMHVNEGNIRDFPCFGEITD